MPNYRYLLLSLLLLLAALSCGWLMLSSKSAIKNQTHEDPNHPNAFAEDVLAITMDKTGKLQNQLYSPKMTHYSNNSTLFLAPHLVIHTQASPPWIIDAKCGRAQNGVNEIELWNDVKIHQAAGSKNREATITTSAVTVFPNRQYAETNQPVSLLEPGIKINSIGVRAFLKESRVELLSQARGRYDPTS